MDQASQHAAIAGAEALANRPDFTPLLDGIDVPTLILVGLEDSIYPLEISQEMHSMIAGSELVILDGAAHAANLEAAEQANAAILDWSADIASSTPPTTTPPTTPLPMPGDGDGATGTTEYPASLESLNGSGASGAAKLRVDEATNQLHVSLTASGLTPGVEHLQHIHGFRDMAATCPTEEANSDGDGLLTTAEGALAYGAVSEPTSGEQRSEVLLPLRERGRGWIGKPSGRASWCTRPEHPAISVPPPSLP